MVNSSYMKVSEIPVKSGPLSEDDIKQAYVLGMKNVYPEDATPVHELQKFPLTAYLSDIDLKTTGQLIQRMRNINVEVNEQKEKLENLVSNVKTITAAEVEKANLQSNENVLTFDEVTSQLSNKFASPEEFQTVINNVYGELFSAVEEMMVQIFTTSMYARQYKPIIDDEYLKEEDN
jgi:uncharacterized protein YoxC